MRYILAFFFFGAILVSSSAWSDGLQGRERLILRPHGNETPELLEPVWTPDTPVLDLDISAVEVKANGSILVWGRTESDGEKKIVVAKYLPNGLPDRSFGTNGAAYFDASKGTYPTQVIVSKAEKK